MISDIRICTASTQQAPIGPSADFEPEQLLFHAPEDAVNAILVMACDLIRHTGVIFEAEDVEFEISHHVVEPDLLHLLMMACVTLTFDNTIQYSAHPWTPWQGSVVWKAPTHAPSHQRQALKRNIETMNKATSVACVPSFRQPLDFHFSTFFFSSFFFGWPTQLFGGAYLLCTP